MRAKLGEEADIGQSRWSKLSNTYPIMRLLEMYEFHAVYGATLQFDVDPVAFGPSMAKTVAIQKLAGLPEDGSGYVRVVGMHVKDVGFMPTMSAWYIGGVVLVTGVMGHLSGGPLNLLTKDSTPVFRCGMFYVAHTQHCVRTRHWVRSEFYRPSITKRDGSLAPYLLQRVDHLRHAEDDAPPVDLVLHAYDYVIAACGSHCLPFIVRGHDFSRPYTAHYRYVDELLRYSTQSPDLFTTDRVTPMPAGHLERTFVFCAYEISTDFALGQMSSPPYRFQHAYVLATLDMLGLVNWNLDIRDAPQILNVSQRMTLVGETQWTGFPKCDRDMLSAMTSSHSVITEYAFDRSSRHVFGKYYSTHAMDVLRANLPSGYHTPFEYAITSSYWMYLLDLPIPRPLKVARTEDEVRRLNKPTSQWRLIPSLLRISVTLATVSKMLIGIPFPEEIRLHIIKQLTTYSSEGPLAGVLRSDAFGPLYYDSARGPPLPSSLKTGIRPAQCYADL